MKKYDRMAAAFLTLVGIAVAMHAWLNLHLGSLKLPNSGFMPFIASMVLTISSAIWFIQSAGPDPDAQPFWAARGWLKPALSVVMMLLYAWSMNKLGYTLSTLIFMLVWQFLIEREKWLKATVIAVTATLVMWLLFSRLLGVPLPTGILTI